MVIEITLKCEHCGQVYQTDTYHTAEAAIEHIKKNFIPYIMETHTTTEHTDTQTRTDHWTSTN